jgi:hypothetical protein
MAIAVAGLTAALAIGAILAASGRAQPGDALYPVKRSTERAQLALAGSDLSRGRLYLDFARTRLGEAQTVSTDADGFGGAMAGMDADTSHGVRLLTTSAMAHKDAAALDTVDRFVADQRHRVNQLTAVAGPGSQGPVGTSLALLDAVSVRSQSLRAALACGVGATANADSLGPLAQECPVSSVAPGRSSRWPAADSRS